MSLPSGKSGPCSLGTACTAKNEELSGEYRCRHCNKQLHGFISGCSQAKNAKDFRDGVICKNQPCHGGAKTHGGSRSDGAAIAQAAGLPEFLWDTQLPKRKRDPSAPKLKRQRYTKEHKHTVLEALQRADSKLPEVAKQFQIPEGTLRGWYDDDRRQKQAAAAAAALEEENLPEPTLLANMQANDSAAVEAVAVDGGVDVTADVEEELTPAPPKKKTRQRYSNETKIQVILALETRKNVSLNEVAKEFNVAAGTVRGWREEADKIQKQAMDNRRVGAKANPSRDPLKKVWDAILTLFEKNSRLPLAQRLEVNVAVVRTIGKQARDNLLEAHAQSPILNPTELINMQKFKASETWARKWARDREVISSKSEPINRAELAQARVSELQQIISQYPPDNVYSMTSSGLFFRVLPHRAYVSKLEENDDASDDKRVRACKGLKSKDRMTLYMCANESGLDRLPITCIGKYEHPACFRVGAQKALPYLYQKQALSDAGTFQMWWRTVFLPHMRQTQEGEKVLLLVESVGPCEADLLKDPTDQVRVEALPPSYSTTMVYAKKEKEDSKEKGVPTVPSLPQCQAMEYGILETVKRRYRYRLLQEVMDAFDERHIRRQVANEANYPMGSRGLREGSLAHIGDSMRLLDIIWKEVAKTTITKAWQKTKLRVKPKDADAAPTTTPGHRAKSEKRQTTREKKQLMKDLNAFLKRHESEDFSKEGGSNQLEEMVEKLKNTFLYTDGEVIEMKEMMESLEEWVGLEDSQGMISLFMGEIKEEMNIAYLVGLKEVKEGVVPEAEEPEDAQLESPLPSTNAGEEKLDAKTAMSLATAIKSTACKLLDHGNILGKLAVQLDEASDSIFRLLRKQKAAAKAKELVDQQKTLKKATAAVQQQQEAEALADAHMGAEGVAAAEVLPNLEDLGDGDTPMEIHNV